MGKIVKTANLGFTYKSHDNDSHGVNALSGINLEIEKGSFTVVIGRNGSGKSTFAKLLNALLQPTYGYVYINGMDTRDGKHIWEIRRSAGMVFQNPDNQIIATTVEEDVAFGPENIGLASEEIVKRVKEALETVNISEFARSAPHLLSGGQKQKVAIAGILAMKPECIILDEATSMLDPIGRKELMQVLLRLNKDEGITLIHITHNMDEACLADRVTVMDNGRIIMDGKPGEVFSRVDEIKRLGLDVPQVTELFYELNKEGYDLPLNVFSTEDALNTMAAFLKSRTDTCK